MSSFDGKHHIGIAGTGFQLSINPRTHKLIYAKREAPSFVNKFSNGDPSYRDSSFYSHFVQLDWSNQSGQEFFNDGARFYKSLGTDTASAATKVLLAKQNYSAGYPALETSATIFGFVSKGGQGGDTLYALAGGSRNSNTDSTTTAAVWSWDGTTSWTKIALSLWRAYCGVQSFVNPAATSGALYIGVGSESEGVANAGAYYLSASYTVPVALTGFGSVANATLSIADYNGTLYLGTSPNGWVLNSTNGTTVATLKQLNMGSVRALVNYGGFLFAGGGDGLGGTDTNYNGHLWRFDGTNWVEIANTNWTRIEKMVVFDSLLFIGTGSGQIYVYNGATMDLLFKVPGGPKILDMAVYNDSLIVQTAINTGYDSFWTFDRRGFLNSIPLATAATGTTTLGAPAYSHGILAYQNNLMIAANTSTQVLYTTSSAVFVSSGTLQSSYFDANLPSFDKLWHSMEVQYDNLPTSTSIALAYKTDESDSSWTTLGTAASANTTRSVYPFSVGTTSKKLSYQLTLKDTSGQTSASPSVRKVITKYVIKPDFYHMWDLQVEATDKVWLLDGSFETNNGLNLEAAIFANRRSKSLVEFRDMDYVSANISGTITSGNTSIPVFSDPTTGFALQGRLRIPSLSCEVTYTSANVSAFTGVSWGYKNSFIPPSAATSTLIDTSYMTLFSEFNESNTFDNQPNGNYEQVLPLRLLET